MSNTIVSNYQTDIPVQLGQGMTSVSGSTIYTVPINIRATVQDITVCNTSSSTATFDVYLVPVLGSSAVSNAIFYQCPLTANQTVQWTGTQPIFAGGTVIIKGSGTAISVTVGGTQAS